MYNIKKYNNKEKIMYEIELDDFSEKGLKDFCNILIKNSYTLDNLFLFDVDSEIEDLTEKGEELLNQIEVQGEDWEKYYPASGPSYSSGGEPAEGGYFNSISITLYINKKNIDLSDFIEEKRKESILEKLSEDYFESL